MEGKNDMPKVGRIEQLTTNPRFNSGVHSFPPDHVWKATGPMIDLDRDRQIERLARALAKRDGYQWSNFALNDEYVYREEAKEMLDYMDTLEVE